MKISICIPTYNRADRLEALLNQLCGMITERNYHEAIEICISDNCSDDRSFEILKGLSSDHHFLKYKRNSKNLGFGLNFWSVAQMASGDYIYFTGDDDPFERNGLDLLLHHFECNADLVLFNSHPTAYLYKKALSGGEIITLNSLESYREQVGLFHASFIGNLMFRREVFEQYSEIGDAVFQSAYPHLFPVFRALREEHCIFANHSITKPDDSLRDWRKMQPIYTSIDMARIVKQEMIPFVGTAVGRRLMLQLARSLPRAFFRLLSGAVRPDMENPYQSLRLRNLNSIYGMLGKGARA